MPERLLILSEEDLDRKLALITGLAKIDGESDLTFVSFDHIGKGLRGTQAFLDKSPIQVDTRVAIYVDDPVISGLSSQAKLLVYRKADPYTVSSPVVRYTNSIRQKYLDQMDAVFQEVLGVTMSDYVNLEMRTVAFDGKLDFLRDPNNFIVYEQSPTSIFLDCSYQRDPRHAISALIAGTDYTQSEIIHHDPRHGTMGIYGPWQGNKRDRVAEVEIIEGQRTVQPGIDVLTNSIFVTHNGELQECAKSLLDGTQ